MANLKGKCEVCGKEPRILTELKSGQKLCRTCYHQIHPTRPKHMATYAQIDRFREREFDVGDDLTKEDVKRLNEEWKKRRPSIIRTKIRGVSYQNHNGESRQKLIKKCKQGDKLILIREPGSKYDPNEIGVYTAGGFLKKKKKLGALSENLSSKYAAYIDAGGVTEVEITEITGGKRVGFFRRKQLYGVNIMITYYNRSVEWDEPVFGF